MYKAASFSKFSAQQSLVKTIIIWIHMGLLAVCGRRLKTSSILHVTQGTASTQKTQKTMFDSLSVLPMEVSFHKQFNHVKVGACFYWS